MASRVVAILCLALAWGVAQAHDFWIEPSSFRPLPGGPVAAKLRVGTGFRGDLVPRDDAHLVKLSLVGPAKEQPLVGRDGSDPAGFARVQEAGLYVVGYQSGGSLVDLDAAKVAVYVEEEGLEPFLRLDAREKASGIRDHFARCAKALLMAGNPGPEAKGFDRKLGLPLELIPEANPYALPKSQALPLQLLRDGKPLAGALLTAMRREAPERKVSARTDARGRVALPIEGSGMWLVKTVHIVRGQEPRTWNSLWASLTFEVLGGR